MRVFLGHTFTARRREIAEALMALPGTEVVAFDPKGQPAAPGVRPVTFPLPPAPENGDALLTLSGGGTVNLNGIQENQVDASYFAT